MRFVFLLMWCGSPQWVLAQDSAAGQDSKAQQPPAAEASPADETKPADQEDPSPSASRALLSPGWSEKLSWREIGPTSMGGRIVDLAVVPSDPATFYVATASGGLFKTSNCGVTFTPQFQFENTISIGDVCVSPSHPDIVWVGTGEHNGRNSVSWGDGVYKSLDGGKTWRNMGLRKTFQIGQIAIHPENPDIVYVGALGRLWGSNTERGVYKTTDGGETWEQVLYIDDATGCIDLKMSPADPNTLLAATFERKRDAYDGGDPEKKWGWGSGLFKTTDGGKSWRRMTNGLPSVRMGRIGLDYYAADPTIVYALVDSEKIGSGPEPSERPAVMGIQGGDNDAPAVLSTVSGGGAAAAAGLKVGDQVVGIGEHEIKTYADLVAQIRAHHAGDQVKVKVLRGEEDVTVDLTFGARAGRGTQFSASLGGQQQNAQSRQGDDGFQTGGVFQSKDGGESWTRINSLNPRPFYFSQIRVDPSDNRFLYVLGIQLFRSTNGGRTFRPDAGNGTHADHHALWIDPSDGRHLILGCDGGLNITHDRARTWEFLDHLAIGQFYHVGVDTRAPYNVYGGLQDNGSWGGPSATRTSRGPTVDEWFAVGGGDGFVCLVDPNDPNLVYYESQYGRIGRVDLGTGARARLRMPAVGGNRARFNWKTPFLLSSHNTRIFYCAGNYVFKSLDRGNDLRVISPEITATRRGTGTALAESPVDPDVLYVGTDDGNLWLTRNGGSDWTKLSVESLPGPRRVQSIAASRFEAGRAYVVFDGHYYDDDEPYVFATEDYGDTWTSLRSNLPVGSTRVLREDLAHGQLLYLGTEFGIWISVDRGGHWTRINNNLPHVAVHEIAVHPTAGEIVAATHGRSLWVLDVTPLRQATADVLAQPIHLFKPQPAVMWQAAVGRRYYGHKRFVGQNPAAGATLYYSLAEKAENVRVTISDVENKTISRLNASEAPGLNRVVWNLRRQAQRGNRGGTTRVEPGTYLVTLDVDGQSFKQTITVNPDPDYPARTLTFEEEEALFEREGRIDQ